MEGSLRLQCIGAVLLIFIKARGQKKKKKKKSNSSQEGKMVLTLGCTIQALSYLSVASPGFYCLLPA